jgi:hypothetical protein
MLAAALQWEFCAYIETHADQLDSDGYRLVVRNGSVVVAGTGLPRPPDVGRQDTTRITQHVTAGRPPTTRKPALPVECEACGYCASFPPDTVGETIAPARGVAVPGRPDHRAGPPNRQASAGGGTRDYLTARR